MTSSPFVEYVRLNRARVEGALDDALPRGQVAGTQAFNEALRYAVFPGGKRLRAYLALIAARLTGNSEEQAVTLACAIEFIHTSSLVLDDLPSMDDADLRRRRPALHLVFGEAPAILVGVALLNQAYALFARAVATDAPVARLQRLLAEVSRCIGGGGMIAGQAAELALSGSRRTDEALASRDLKTTALMRLTLVAGAIAAGCAETNIAALAAFGECLGGVYQIHDDIADAFGDCQSTGKTVGQDARHVRPSQTRLTLSSEDGVQEVAKRAAATMSAGKAMLDPFRGRPGAALLESAANFILEGFDRVAARTLSRSLP